ncbi:MAG: hypothetical protein KDA59_16400 [Planctomycetales bacterium]|nr:hypothetical protein [Planctomycetales bacterium]
MNPESLKAEPPSPKQRTQFSIRSLLAITTVLCICLAVPVLALTLGVFLWAVIQPLVIAALVLAALALMQMPLYFVYRRIKREAERDGEI